MPDAVLWNLGAIYVPVLVLLWFSMIYAISRYRIDKATHEANLAALAAAPVKSGGRHIGPPGLRTRRTGERDDGYEQS